MNAQTSQPTIRHFKVMEPMMGLTGSELRFRGTWLKNLGFHPGARVQLTSSEAGVIELRVVDAAHSPPKTSRLRLHPSLGSDYEHLSSLPGRDLHPLPQ